MALANHNRECAVGKDIEGCGEVCGHFMCTLRKGHKGQHEACGGHSVLLTWARKAKPKSSESSKGAK